MLTKTIRLEKITENGERYSLEEVLELDETNRTINPLIHEGSKSIRESAFSDIMEAYRDYKMCDEW